MLVKAILEHDSHIDEYNKKAEQCVRRFHVDNEDNIKGFDEAIAEVMSKPVKTLSSEEKKVLDEETTQISKDQAKAAKKPAK